MAVSQQQKVDFLLKKLGFTKTKTGLAVDSTLTGTKKAGFAEAIPSPLIIANSSVWNEADSIPATPPGSDTNQVRVYLAASSGHRMTVDSTVANNRAFIAFSTYNDTSSTRLNNWIDTQFGAGYLIKVFKGDPNSGGVQLSAAGSGANDGWFFDYSAGVLNFNDTNVPSGVTGTNIYIVGYRYIGQTGAPTSGISTFSFFDLSVERNLDVGVQGGISTFRNNIDANGIIEGVAGENKIPFLYSDLASLPSAGTYHGMFAHVHSEGRGYFAHAGNWLELVNKDTSGNVGLSGDLDVDGHTNLDNVSIAGVTTAAGNIVANGNIDLAGDIDVDGHTNLDNVSVAGVTTFSDDAHFKDTVRFQDTGGNSKINYFTFGRLQFNDNVQAAFGNASQGRIGSDGSHLTISNNAGGSYTGIGNIKIQADAGKESIVGIQSGSVELYYDNTKRFETASSGINVVGTTTSTQLAITGISTFTGNIDANGDLDVDGHTNLDNLSVAGVTTFSDDINIPDATFVRIGNHLGGDFNITHDNNTIARQHGSGNFILDLLGDNRSFAVTRSNLSETVANFKTNGSVDLYFDNTKRFETTNTGVTVTGTVVATGADINGDIDVDGHTNLDNVSIAGFTTITQDLNVDGHTNLDNVSIAGVTSVASLTSGRVVLAGTGGKLEDSNKLTFDGTTLGLTGNANVTGNLTVGGVLTYEDVKNVDAVGLITARSGIRVTSGVIEAQAGENKIPSLYSAMGNLPSAGSYHGMFAHVHATGRGYFAHAGNWLELVNREINGVVGTGTETYNIGNLVSTSSTTTSLNVVGVATFGGNVDVNGNIFDADGHVNLDNVSIAGVTTATGLVGFGTDTTYEDYAKIRLGNKVSGGNRVGDFVIGHNPTLYGGVYNELISTNGNILLENRDTGTHKYLYLKSDQVQIRSYTGNESFITCGLNADVKLYYDNVQKLVTTSTGISVAGTIVATGADINGDLDVDGHTNLDNVSIAGVTTMSGNLIISNSLPQIYLQDTDHNSDYAIWNHDGVFRIVDVTNSNATRFSILPDGTTTVNQNLNAGNGVDITGLLTVSGDSDLNGDLDVDGHTNLDNVSVAGFSTFSSGIHLNADVSGGSSTNRLYIGVGQDLELFHDGANSYIRNHTGNLLLSDTNHTYFKGFTSDKSAACLFNNSVKLQTTNTGINVTGNVVSDGLTVDGDTDLNGDLDVDGHTNLDNVSVAGFTTITQDLNVDGHTNLDNVSVAGVTTFSDTVEVGTGVTALTNGNVSIGGTLELFNTTGDALNNPSEIKISSLTISQHNNTGTYKINNSNATGSLLLSAGGSGYGGIQFWNGNFSRQYFIAQDQGSVKLFHNNTARFETSGVGATVYGNLDVTADLDVDGHTNLDNVSIAGVTTFADDVTFTTANGNNIVFDKSDNSLQFGDSVAAKFGSGNDLSLFHSGSVGVLRNSQGNFKIEPRPGEKGLVILPNAGVELYYDNNQKLVTTSSGISVAGTIVATGADINGDLDVDGHTNLDNLSVAGVTTFATTAEFDGTAKFDSTITAGGSTGTNGQYLKSTGSGVSWASFPTLRTRQTFTASAGQTTFSFSYNVNFVDVFVNGIKLTDAEFTATNGSSVVLAVGCFVGDIVELVSYNTVSGGGGGGGGTLNNIVEDTTPQLGGNLDLFNKSITGTGNVNITGVATATKFVGDGSGLVGVIASGTGVIIKNSGSTVGTAGTINFGDNLSVSALSGGAVTISAGAASTSDVSTNSLNVVGIATLGSGSSGQAFLQYQGSTKLTTANWGTQVFGTLQTNNFLKTLNQNSSTNGKSIFLTNTSGNLLEIGHTSSNSFITGHVGNISINAPTVSISTNFSVGGISTFSEGLFIPDDKKLQLGDSQDLQIFHQTNPEETIIHHTGTGVFKIQGNGGNNIFIRPKIGENSITAKPDAEVELFYNGVLRFETTPQGIEVVGHSELDNVNIAGVVTATTFKGALEATSASFSSNIDANGNLDVAGTATLGSGGSGQAILEYQGTTRLKTEVDRIDTFGHLNVGGNVDNALLRLGQSNDLVLTHDGDQSFINNLTSNLNINAPTVVVGTGLSVGGISTFTGAIDANGDLDVDGHTNLDNVNIVGVTTTTGNLNVTDGRILIAQSTVPQIRINSSSSDGSSTRFSFGMATGNNNFINGAVSNDACITAPQEIKFGIGSSLRFRITNTYLIPNVDIIPNGNNVRSLGNSSYRWSDLYSVDANISGDLDVDGHTNLDNVSVAGVMTATSFVGDGSGLTGITASGSGVVIKHDGSTVGTAGTINFSTNLDVSAISAGIVTVTASGGGSATTINNNADNRLITGSGTANTLEGESNLLFDGTDLTNSAGDIAAANGSAGSPSFRNYTDTDTGMFFPSANHLAFATSGFSRVVIDNNDGMIIGNGQVRSTKVGNRLTVGGPTHAGVTIKSGTSSAGSLYFSDGTSGDDEQRGLVQYDHSSNFLRFYTNAGERLRIASSGQIGLSGANYGTSGQVLTSQGSGSAATWTTISSSPDVGITTNLSGTFTASAGSPSTINTFGYGSGDIVVEYTVFIKNGSDFQSQKLLAMRDGTTIHSTQFAVMYSSSLLVQLDATISSGNILLRATPETGVSGSTTYKVKREVM